MEYYKMKNESLMLPVKKSVTVMTAFHTGHAL